MGTEPWRNKDKVLDDDDSPAVYVSWNDAQEFMRMLGDGYRLPTEAEWEYACRAGTSTVYSFGESGSDLDEYAWYRKNAWDNGDYYAHIVGQKKPNGWGLYDIHANVWEFCSDSYGGYPSLWMTDPTGPSSGSSRVLRSGSWYAPPRNCNSAVRTNGSPTFSSQGHGFRVCRSSL